LAGVWSRGASQIIWDPLLISATVEASNFKFGIQLGYGTNLPKKQRLGPKLAGGLAREASQKMWDPLRIFATVEASNFKFGIKKTTFRTKIGGGLGQGSIQKNLI